MTGPRDIPAAGQAINYETGQPLSDWQVRHLAALHMAAHPLLAAMHQADGSTEPTVPHHEHTWSSRRMSIAASLVEMAVMFAKRAALEHR